MKIVRGKIIVIGPHSVGKTSIVERYQTKIFTPQKSCTVGASFSHIQMMINDQKVKMQVWDTAGQERFRSMAPMYYRGANGALLVFDLTDAESLNELKEWSRDLLSIINPDSLVLVVAGNKCDDDVNRKIRDKDARDFAKDLEAKYFETSAMKNICIDEVFEYLGSELARKSEESTQQR
ncbi:Ras-related protein Rab-22A [Armadillidium vulgare]|nr:Ras-related protein Rab-22A [Armadillidium vulgare]